MLSTNFEKVMLSKLNEVFQFTTQNKHSDFYKKKYSGENLKTISSWEDFQKIPLLNKDEFSGLDISKRTFVSIDNIAYYSISSGTTNHRKPTVIPHSSFYHDSIEKYQFNADFFAKIDVSSILCLLPQMSSLSFRAATIPNHPARIINGDLHNIPATIQLINLLHIEGILTTATALDFVITELRKISFDFDKIKWISLGGETCSSLKLNYFKKTFPSAYFYMRFGNSEIGGARHYQCEFLHKNSHNSFHIDNTVELIEIVDEDGKNLKVGEIGEIVHTDLSKKAFPLVRYKTRDMGKIKKKDCPCGNSYILTIEGKSGFDSLKVFGTTLRTEIISQALQSSQDLVEPHFQLHVFEQEVPTGIKPKLELHLKLKDSTSSRNENSYVLEILAEKISAKFQISPSKTLKDLAEEGIFMPLEIKLVKSWPIEMKSKNIISHLS